MGLSSNGDESPSASGGSCRRKAEPGKDKQRCLQRKRGLEKRCLAEMLIEGCRTSGVGPHAAHAASVPLSFPRCKKPSGFDCSHREGTQLVSARESRLQGGPAELPDGSRMT